jgi:hypothetical protein
MRNYTPKAIPSYKWNYALGLYHDLEKNRVEFYDLYIENRKEDNNFKNCFGGFGTYADPTLRTVYQDMHLSHLEKNKFREILSVDMALTHFDNTEINFFKKHVRAGASMECLAQQIYPLSLRTMKRRKSEFVRLILYYLSAEI